MSFNPSDYKSCNECSGCSQSDAYHRPDEEEEDKKYDTVR